jgi:general secretion pathway protein A
VWLRHWGLARDPFASPDSAYVALPAHDRAVVRLVSAIETAQPIVGVTAPAGLGKSTVLRQALAAASNPLRRIAMVSCLGESTLLVSALAERLGERVGRQPTRSVALRAIDRACRLAALQRCHVVLAIDGCDDGIAEHVPREIAALVRLTASAGAGLTVIQVGRTDLLHSADAISWNAVVVELEPLTRSQTERFLSEKLERVGSGAWIFTSRAITRLHGWSRGVPRRVEQLATLTLKAGSSDGKNVIAPELVDAVAASFGHLPALVPGWHLPVSG